MRRAVLAFAAVFLFSAPAAAQGLEDAKKCASGSIDRDLRIQHCTRAIQSGGLSREDLAITYNNRGFAYNNKGQYDRAIQDYDQALSLDPNFALAYRNRGAVYSREGQHGRAIGDYTQAVRLDTNDARDHNSLAWLLATAPDPSIRNGADAVRYAERAVALDDSAYNRDTLAAAYAEAGRFADAVAQQQQAISLLQKYGGGDALAGFYERLDLYRKNQPYRD